MSISELSKRPVTCSSHELRDIKKHVLLRKTRLTKSLSLTDLLDNINTKELFDINGNKCSPRKKVGEGSGSSGVYEIEYDENIELNSDKKVVKIIDILNKTLRKDFIQEINILKKTDSPQIVRFFGTVRNDPSHNVDNPEIGMILEYCENGDLYHHLNMMYDNKLILQDNIMIKWCNESILAIKYLHSHKFIHRDIKSLNYLVGNNNQIKLSDFGKTREDNARNRDNTLKKLRSSPCWTAPELCCWNQEVDINEDVNINIATYSSDIYALTIVLWEIIYYFYHQKYKKPYTGNIYEIYNKISNNKRPKINKLFSRGCKHFLKRGWNVDRDKRPSANKLIRKFNEIRF